MDLTGEEDDRAMAAALQRKFDQEAVPPAAGMAAGSVAPKARAAGGGQSGKPSGRLKKGGAARGGGPSGGGTAGAGEKRRSVLDMLGAAPKRQA